MTIHDCYISSRTPARIIAVSWGRGSVVRRWRRAAIAVVLASATAAMLCCTGALACKGTSLQPTRANLTRVTAATLCLIEHERLAYRLEPLRSNGSLQRIGSETGQRNGDRRLLRR